MDPVDGNIVAAYQVGNHLIGARTAQLVVESLVPGLVRESLNRDEITWLAADLGGDFVQFGLLVLS